MGIWGTSSPSIQVVSSGTDITLTYGLIQRNEPDYDRLKHQNPISSHKQFVNRGYWWIFEVMIFLYKHGAETYNKYIELADLLHSEVYIKPYGDHGFLQNASGNVPFYFSELRPVELTTDNYETGLVCLFESKEYVDISINANLSAVESDLIAFWPLNETSGTRVDSIGSLDLTEVGTVGNVSGVVGNAAQTAAAGNIISSDNTALKFEDAEDFTFFGWLRFTSLSASRTVLSKYGSGDSNHEYRLYYNNISGFLDWSVYANGGASPQNVQIAISVDTTYFFIVWYDATSQKVGIQLNNGSATIANAASGVQTGSALFSLMALNISGGTDRMHGWIDAVGCLNRLLTDAEKTALYNSGSGVEF